MNRRHPIFFSFFLLMIALPLIQMKFVLIQEPTLEGITLLTNKIPRLRMASWWSGDFQKSLEQWFEQAMGFRGFLIKTDNQINFSFFKEIDRTEGTKIILGKDNYLYESHYITAASRKPAASDELLRSRADQLLELQSRLDQSGIKLIFIISPSKAEIYPEFIPERFLGGRRPEQSSYRKLLPLLRERKVNVLDGHEMCARLKSTSQYPVFTRASTHWSMYASGLFANDVVEKINELNNKPVVRLDVSNVHVVSRCIGVDADLFNIINMWSEDPLLESVARIKPKKLYDTRPEEKPSILMVGSSFCWNIIHHLKIYSACRDLDFYYYYKRKYANGTETPFERTHQTKESLFGGKNLVIIETNESCLEELGFGFVEHALELLKKETDIRGS